MSNPNDRARELIEKYIDLIDTNHFEDLYLNLYQEVADNNSAVIGAISYMLECAGINPLNYLDYVPKHYAAYRQDLEEIIIPDHITSIDNGAFKFCSNVKKVIIPEGVFALGEQAFAANTNMQKVEFPSTLVKIGKQCFFNCSSLVDYKFNEGLREIGNDAFWGTKKTTVEIPSTVTMIGSRAWGTMKMTYRLHRGAPVLGAYANGHLEYID